MFKIRKRHKIVLWQVIFCFTFAVMGFLAGWDFGSLNAGKRYHDQLNQVGVTCDDVLRIGC